MEYHAFEHINSFDLLVWGIAYLAWRYLTRRREEEAPAETEPEPPTIENYANEGGREVMEVLRTPLDQDKMS